MNILSEIEAVKNLKNGDPLIFQTDTLPAISCKPEYSEMIYKIKKRDKKKPLILMGSDIQQVLSYVDSKAIDDFQKIAKKYWPGPLTLIIPISSEKSLNFISNENSLGIRIPKSLTAQSLISKIGPLATSSANISGFDPSLTAGKVTKDFPDVDILGPVPWDKCSGFGSTIISWVNKGKWELIRSGQIYIPEIY